MSIGGASPPPPLAPALSEFSAFFKLSKYTLRIPASSAPVERNFSTSGLIMRPQRARKALFGNVRNPCLLEM